MQQTENTNNVSITRQHKNSVSVRSKKTKSPICLPCASFCLHRESKNE